MKVLVLGRAEGKTAITTQVFLQTPGSLLLVCNHIMEEYVHRIVPKERWKDVKVAHRDIREELRGRSHPAYPLPVIVDDADLLMQNILGVDPMLIALTGQLVEVQRG